MPIYEYYCPDNHTIYQFYAKTVAQGQRIPKCPDNPRFRMQKAVSSFAISSGGSKEEPPAAKPDTAADDPADARMEAAMESMEKEFSSIDENDPRAMARMMRKMSELSGEKIEGEFEEVVRKLEEGTDPETLEEQMGGAGDQPEDSGDPMGGGMGLDPGMPGAKGPADPKEARHRFKARRAPLRRDPKLYDYE